MSTTEAMSLFADMDINETYDGNTTETLEHLNARYAEALLPLTVTFGFFTFLGFLGNGIILLVFTLSRDYRRNNFKVFVLTLGVIDIITCVTLIPAEMVKQRHYFAFGDVIPCKVKCFFNVFGASSSCLALLVISVDRYRKVVQPFRKQLTPKLAVRILFLVAFIFPVLLAIPGTIMCGIKHTNMTNIDGGLTEIQLCETEDQYRVSIWRLVYKYVFVILMVGISFTYVVLYTFVMKEATRQIRAIAAQRKNSNYDISFSSGIFDPNTIIHEPLNTQDIPKQTTIPNQRSLSKSSVEADLLTNGNGKTRHQSGSARPNHYSKKSKVSAQLSVKSLSPILQRQGFPTKTIIWFILTIVFIISYMTHLVLALKVADIVHMTPTQFACFSFFYRIYFFNHMINPVVYAIFVKRFRASCRSVFPTLKTRLGNCLFNR